MVSYTLSPQAYYKVFFHASKHLHQPVNGVLIGQQKGSTVSVEDAVPLLHHWTSLSPMMEIGLDLATRHAEASSLKVVGYYQACERIEDTALAPVGEKVAAKIREGFSNAVAFVIDGEKFGTDEVALVPYIPNGSSWKPYSSDTPLFSSSSDFQLESPDLPSKAVGFVRDDFLHHAFGDFDDHLEDVTIDWLNNRTCLPAGM